MPELDPTPMDKPVKFLQRNLYARLTPKLGFAFGKKAMRAKPASLFHGNFGAWSTVQKMLRETGQHPLGDKTPNGVPIFPKNWAYRSLAKAQA